MSFLKRESLDQKKILRHIESKLQKKIHTFEILQEVDSTNTYLLNKNLSTYKNLKPGQGIICLAEKQTAGHGRFGRIWESPKKQNLYLSLLWNSRKTILHLPTLSLVTAIAVIQALKQYDDLLVKGLELKWPNDILYSGKKFGGILLENKHQKASDQIVIGIGLNTYLSKRRRAKISQPCTDLQTILKKTPKRNQLAGLVIEKLFEALITFEKEGLSPFLRTWYQFDSLLGRHLIVETQNKQTQGIVLGIDNQGALMLKDKQGKVHCIKSGTVQYKYQ